MNPMTREPKEIIAALLGEIDGPGAPRRFSAQRMVPPDDLHLEVRGVGPLRLPVPDEQAALLCQVGRPALYGKGEETLHDPGVRDTWEIPLSRVRIDKRRWNKTLLSVLDALRADLGLPPGCHLGAELHSMLVYAPGQFFLPHQDSEKQDEMIGSLVVTLPASFTGGSLIVEHDGQRTTTRGSKQSLSFLAFYADCHHEVKPVTSGYRTVLTYNLLLHEDGPGTAAPDVDPEVVDDLAALLGAHFSQPTPPRWPGDRSAGNVPVRLVYLLDHEYTERGMAWPRLKSVDAGRAAVIRAAAELADCDAVLGLAEVHETWSATDEDVRSGRHRSARGGWDDDDDEDEVTDDADYVLDELIDSDTDVRCWMDPASPGNGPVALPAATSEVCASTPSGQLAPHTSEHEGYMGNWGNTLDRWYSRGAVVIWPRANAFVVRAEADPAWALDSIATRLRAGQLGEARQLTASLEPFWASVTRTALASPAVEVALWVAGELQDPALAALVLGPLGLEDLGQSHAVALAGLLDAYDASYVARLLDRWAARRSTPPGAPAPRTDWMVSLPAICKALTKRGASGSTMAALMLQVTWRQLATAIDGSLALSAPSKRAHALAEKVPALTAVLHGLAVIGANDQRDEVISFCRAGGEPMLPCVIGALRAAATLRPGVRRAAGLDDLAARCSERLTARLAAPVRERDDWSIRPPDGCGCELCSRVAHYLSDRTRRVLEWPLAKDGRQHVHALIDRAELPVSHVTRRTGRPFTLVLTKTDALFEAEEQQRSRDRADVAWLRRSL
jgi:hypothetical protein